ncbi:hypothetical protein [Bradyrhizobium sp. HKCCYLRH3097]|uniref:hypothetical protein n=2 Tax=unclassified Bradyrhizobium TaxID=2631580 RepID=UPI003EBDCBC3
MRTFARFLLFSFVACQCAAAHAQNPATDLMWEAFQRSMLDKDHFDVWVNANASRFDSTFQRCLNQKVTGLQACAQEGERICQQLPGDFQAKCHKENQCAALLLWSASIQARIQNAVPWRQTWQGQVLDQAEYQCKQYETVMPNACALVYQLAAEAFRQNERVYRGILFCPSG